MKTKKNTTTKGVLTALSISALLLLTSCGSFQYATYDDDGIYGNTNTTVASTIPAPAVNNTPAPAPQNEYKDYFAKKSQQYDDIPQEGAVFTDIESYSSEGYTEENTVPAETGYEPQYSNQQNGAWGSSYNDRAVVNVYNSGWNYGWGGFNRGGFYGGGFYNGYGGWGFQNRWNNGWVFNNGWGWNNFGYYGGGFYCPPFYNNYYSGRPYVYNRYQSPYYARSRRNADAYNRGRSSYATRSNRSVGARSSVSNANRGRSSYSQSQRSARSSVGTNNNRSSTTTTRSSRNNNSQYSRRPSTTTSRSSTPQRTRAYTPRNNSSTRSSRSNTPSPARSSSSSTRSSRSYSAPRSSRSSSSSARSSGGGSRSSSRGRRN